MTISSSRSITIPIIFSFCFGAFAAAAPAADAMPQPASLPTAQAPGTARVWFLHPSDLAYGGGVGAAPVVSANAIPVGALPPGSDFYRDFVPGTYRFTVEPYGLPTGDVNTVQLTAGTQAYLQVQWVQPWQMGYPSGRGANSHSFFVLTMSPQLAQAYLPTLTYLGPR